MIQHRGQSLCGSRREIDHRNLPPFLSLFYLTFRQHLGLSIAIQVPYPRSASNREFYSVSSRKEQKCELLSDRLWVVCLRMRRSRMIALMNSLKIAEETSVTNETRIEAE
ncbi:hypothetical protein PUN28_009826 [Cardiocondyla obscurior]|uniref:Uncharacterized protein n=1 Tax=Cardiocondyla obscurior TaxID=286306 RepID=A0AAW2FNX1_9HYME